MKCPDFYPNGRRKSILCKNRVLYITYHHFPTIDSTNSWAKRHIEELQPNECAIITASEQTHGRGRQGRKWHAPKDKNLYLTFAFFEDIRKAFLFSQIASLSVYDTLLQHGVKATMKWPNDLLASGKKIAGCLTEVDAATSCIIVGVGLNCNMTHTEMQDIGQPATSIFAETGRLSCIEVVQDMLTGHFLQHLETLADCSLEKQMRWQNMLSWMFGRPIRVQTGGACIEGEVLSIAPEGTLRVLLRDGTEYVVQSGDVFV